ncbi:unnamed protein product [Urochloa decumbens]|uniref:Uncharacterized protein n=1 Tax=Urochloa decumbens TaxID=240449 RepID=A0ABC9GDF0_9POAL
MSFRRFVYLVMNDTKRRDFPLRRIDASRLFFPKGERPPAVPLPLEDARLPPAASRFSPPITDTHNGYMEFMLLGGGGGRKRSKVVAADHTGRCVLYDPALRTIRTLPELSAPKFMAAALPIGEDDLYILDKHFHLNPSRDDCFDALIFNEEEGDWDSYALPPPPYADTYDPDYQRFRAHIISYTVVGDGRGGSSIWVSKKGLGTHSFNIGTAKWTKAGDWALPFWGPGRYIPKHKLWIGLSADEDDGVVCAVDLTEKKQPAVPHILWKDLPTPPDWKGKSSFLVHLGHSRFCLARFFWIVQPGGLPCIKFVVFTGLEVERSNGGEELHMVKHRSHRYSLVNNLIHWVL